MKVLLFISSIYKTLDNGTLEEFDELVKNLDNIKQNGNYDVVLISLCDYTENKYVIDSFLNKFRKKDFIIGEQFAGNLHYLNDGSVLYDNNMLDKNKEIVNYVNKLINRGYQVDLIICDGSMDINIENDFDGECTYIYSINSVSDISNQLNEHKKLIYENKTGI